MNETTPKVFLIHRPQIDWDEVTAYLAHVGGERWGSRVMDASTNDAEAIVEFYGRSCYRSWAPGLNPNVTKVREDSDAYHANLLDSFHGSVMEHANFGFMFADVSRVFTHELVRHRAGVAISQESLRYVRLDQIGFRIPPILYDGPDMMVARHTDGTAHAGGTDGMPMRDRIIEIVEILEDFQVEAARAYGLDDEGVDFRIKKEVTSALRRLAPIGLSTSIGWSANIRTLRWVIEQRTEPTAEEEIRLVFDEVARRMVDECPALFGDFVQVHAKGSTIPHWKPEHRKV